MGTRQSRRSGLFGSEPQGWETTRSGGGSFFASEGWDECSTVAMKR